MLPSAQMLKLFLPSKPMLYGAPFRYFANISVPQQPARSLRLDWQKKNLVNLHIPILLHTQAMR